VVKKYAVTNGPINNELNYLQLREVHRLVFQKLRGGHFEVCCLRLPCSVWR